LYTRVAVPRLPIDTLAGWGARIEFEAARAALEMVFAVDMTAL